MKYIYSRGKSYVVKYRGHWKSFKSRDEAKTHLTELQNRPEEKVKRKVKCLTLGEYVDQIFWPSYQANLKPSSRDVMRSELSRIKDLGFLSGMKLKDIDLPMIKLFGSRLSGFSANYRKRLTNRLKQVIETAVDDGCLDRSPYDGVKRKETLVPRDTENRAPESKTNVFKESEIPVLQNAAWDLETFIGVYVRTNLETGFRPGEMMGLKWDDVNFATRTVRIVQARSRGSRLSTPKTGSSLREFEVSKSLIETLKTWRTALNQKRLKTRIWDDHNLVFPSAKGTPMALTNFIDVYWKPLLKKSGLSGRTPHSLRHTCASLDFQSGMNVVQLAKKLGHANPAVTLRTYLHLMNDRPTKKSIEFWDGENSATNLQPQKIPGIR